MNMDAHRCGSSLRRVPQGRGSRETAEYLRDEADIAAYLEAAAADDDPRVLAAALGDVDEDPVRLRRAERLPFLTAATSDKGSRLGVTGIPNPRTARRLR
jgi:hypothetical protein